MTVESDTPTDQEIVAAMAALTQFDYDRQRKDKAKNMGIQVASLDAAVAKMRPAKENTQGGGTPVKFDDVAPYDGEVIGCDVLDEALAHLNRHMHMKYDEAVCLVLWAAHTHIFRRFSHTPRIIITAPAPECGKTVLLYHLLGGLSNKSLAADDLSPAVFFRVVEVYKPTFLIDEVDEWLKEDSQLTASLNSGFEPHGHVMRCAGDDNEVRGFSTFAPVAMSGIGIDTKLKPATLSRSILITLERVKNEISSADTFNEKTHSLGIKLTGSKIAKWTHDIEDQLALVSPALPAGLVNREYDKWHPLFVIAEVAGDAWPDRINSAYQASIHEIEPTKTERFLMDVKTILPDTGNIHTVDLIDKLCRVDDPRYIEYNFKAYDDEKRRIQPRQIANLLKGYKLSSKDVRVGVLVKKGYHCADLIGLFERYIPASVAVASGNEAKTFSQEGIPDSMGNTATLASDGRFSGFPGATPESDVAHVTPSKPLNVKGYCPVAHRAFKTPQGESFSGDDGPDSVEFPKSRDRSDLPDHEIGKSLSGDAELSRTDHAAVLAWLDKIGETDPENIQYTLDTCARNPLTLEWIKGDGEQAPLAHKGNGKAPLASVMPDRPWLERLEDGGITAELRDGKPVYSPADKMTPARWAQVVESEQQIIAELQAKAAAEYPTSVNYTHARK